MNKKCEIILLFDGACMLCSRFVQIPMRLAKGLVFVSTHSPKGKEICRVFGFPDTGQTDTIYLIEERKYKEKSDAVIQILKNCGGGYSIMGYLLTILPKALRDRAYAFVARNRHRFKSKKAHCKLPKSIDRSRVYL